MSEFQQIGDIIDRASELARSGDWTAIDKWVRDFDYVHEKPILGMSLLRSTYPMREKLFYWHDAVARARLHIGDDELRGLF